MSVGSLVSEKPSTPPELTLVPPRLQVPATLQVNQFSNSLLALIDSGAEQNFLDADLVKQAGIAIEPLPTPVPVSVMH